MTRPRVPRQQLVSLLEHDRAQGLALRERQPLPHGLEHRLLFAQETLEGGVEIVERRLAAAALADFVPRFMREALDVVRQVAGELDDRRAEPGLGRQAGALEAGVDEGGELV